MAFYKKVVYSFNNFYLEFLTDLKQYNDNLKKEVKKNFKVFDRASPTYFESLKCAFLASANDDLLVEVLPGTTFKTILDDMPETDVSVLKGYFYIFKVLVGIANYEDETILDKVLDIIKSIQDKHVHLDVLDNKLKDVLDDEIAQTLRMVVDALRNKEESTSPPQGKNNDMFSMLEGSKIGDLAKEISQEIDINSLNISSPEQLLDFSNLSGSNNVLGNIISKVSSTIQRKIEDGQISQSELVNEAMSLVGMLNPGGGGGGGGGLGDIGNIFSNPMFADILNGMKQSGGKNTKVQVDKNKLQKMDTRERLKEKLERRKRDQANDKGDATGKKQ